MQLKRDALLAFAAVKAVIDAIKSRNTGNLSKIKSAIFDVPSASIECSGRVLVVVTALII